MANFPFNGHSYDEPGELEDIDFETYGDDDDADAEVDIDNDSDTGEDTDDNIDTEEPDTSEGEEEGEDEETDTEDMENDEEVDTEDEEDEDSEGEDTEEVPAGEPKEETPIKFEAPEYLPENLVPTQFKDEKEELEFYRKSYPEIINLHKNEDFNNFVLNSYEQQLLEIDQEVDKLKAVKDIFNDNPETAFKIWGQKYLQEMGVPGTINEQEARTYIDNTLKREFGEDYQEHFDRSKMHDLKTISGRMFHRQEKLKQALAQHNQQAEQEYQQYRPPTPEELQERIDKAYTDEGFDQEMKKEEFYNYFESLKKKAASFSLRDIENAVKIEEIKKAEREAGIKEGRKRMMKELEKSGTKPKKSSTQRKEETEEKEDLQPLTPWGRFHEV